MSRRFDGPNPRYSEVFTRYPDGSFSLAVWRKIAWWERVLKLFGYKPPGFKL